MLTWCQFLFFFFYQKLSQHWRHTPPIWHSYMKAWHWLAEITNIKLVSFISLLPSTALFWLNVASFLVPYSGCKLINHLIHKFKCVNVFLCVCPGGRVTGAVFNPALAFSTQFPCSGNSFLEYCLVYWLGPLLGKTSFNICEKAESSHNHLIRSTEKHWFPALCWIFQHTAWLCGSLWSIKRWEPPNTAELQGDDIVISSYSNWNCKQNKTEQNSVMEAFGSLTLTVKLSVQTCIDLNHERLAESGVT